MNDVKYLFAFEDNRYFIKIIGSPRYTNCTGFSYFINKIINENKFEDILVDIRETDFLDSTNLGLLAKLAGAVMSRFDRRMTVISTNNEINDLLNNTGFDKIILLVEQPESFVYNMKQVKTAPEVEINMAEMMLEAHENLLKMNDENNSKFKTVVEMLSSVVNKV